MAPLSEEQLSDYHARLRMAERGILRTLLSVSLLTLFAIVIILPFLYMILISFKDVTEVGSGRFWPRALLDLRDASRRDLVWFRAELTGEEGALLSQAGGAGVRPLAAGTEAAQLADRPGAAAAVLETTLIDALTGRVSVLVEVRDDSKKFAGAPAAALLIPREDGTRAAVRAEAMPRTTLTMTGRLLRNYEQLLDLALLYQGQMLKWLSAGYSRWFLNSLLVASVTVILGLFFDSLAAFAFAKYNFPFRRVLFAILLATIMIPIPVTLVPSFFIFAKLNLYNTYAALILPGLVGAFGIFLARQYMQNIPDDMLDAARVDGASDFQLYRHVVLPASAPILAALAVFRFIFQWNSYLYPLVLTNRDTMKTVQLGLATLQDAQGTIDHGVQMAGATLAVIPILVVYAFMQKHFISGITLGSVKE